MRVIESKGDPEPGSERDVAFQRGLQGMRDTVKRILRSRREGRGQTEIPFIDALLQSGVPDKQVWTSALYCYSCTLLVLPFLLAPSPLFVSIRPLAMKEVPLQYS